MPWVTRALVFLVGVAAVWMLATSTNPQQAEATKVLAECSNSTTDASVINAAVASSDQGDEIVISGQCLINETIRIVGERSYRGESRTGTVLRQADNANLTAILASDSYLDNSPTTGRPVAVRQLSLDGNSDGNTAPTAGFLVRSWQTVVEDLEIRGMEGHGIWFRNESADGTRLTNTSVNGQIVGNFITDSGGHGVFVDDPGNSLTDWNLTDNWIAGSGLDGIHLDNAAGWVVRNNHVYGVPGNAIYANRLWGTSISDNYVEDFGGADEPGTWYGIQATVQGGAASTISSNKVFSFGGESNPDSTYRYIGISQVNYGSGVVSVTGNAIRGAGTASGTGLYYAVGQGDLLTVASTGNIVTEVRTPLRKEGGRSVVVTRGR
jgi:Right handed beta helix region